MQALKDHSDKWSSKRIAGITLLVLCVGIAIVDMFTKFTSNDFIFGTMFGGALALLGVETVMKKINTKRINQRQRDRGVNEAGER